MLNRRHVMIAFAAAALTTAAAGPALAKYPERPIQMLVPWGAGGGSDAVARIIASLMERELGQPIAVVNRAGGNGAVGHQAIAGAKPDGYTIGMITLEVTTMHWVGFSQLTPSDFVPFGQVNFDPAGITVRADAPYQNAGDLLTAIKAQPGKFKSSGGGAGAVSHIAVAGLLKAAGLPANAAPWVTTDSAATAQQELVAGGVEIVGSSLGETRALAEAGKVRSIAVMADERLAGFENIPTVKESSGINWSYSTWRGFGGPKGLPADVVERLSAALEKAYKSQEYADFMKNRGFGMKWRNGPEFAAFMADADKLNGELLKEIGLAK